MEMRQPRIENRRRDYREELRTLGKGPAGPRGRAGSGDVEKVDSDLLNVRNKSVHVTGIIL